MCDQIELQRFVDSVYDDIVYVLANAGASSVPLRKIVINFGGMKT